MRNRIKVRAPGSLVCLCEGVEGRIIQVNIGSGGAVQYNIAWFNDGVRYEEWIFDFEFDKRTVANSETVVTLEEGEE